MGLALLGVAALAVMSVIANSMPYLRLNRDAATASGLARGLHEQIYSRGVGAAGSVFRGDRGDQPIKGFPPLPYPSIVVGEKNYTFKVSCQAAVNCSNAVWVDVEVDWDSDHHLHQQCLYYAP